MFNLFKKIEKSSIKTTGPVDFVIVGLGNPGRKYEFTRHNAGFLAIDYIAKKIGASIDKLKFKGLICDTTFANKRIILLKPQTFMNLSGQSVVEVLKFYKIPIEKLIVIYDDISFNPGKIRIRKKGSAGGHNGMKNIIYLTGSDNFLRIKIGVGSKPANWELADYVTSNFSKEEFSALESSFDNVFEALNLIISGETDTAMNKFNS